MIKLNNRGFSLVEGLLMVIALTLIVGVGVYVVNANKEKKEANNTSQSNNTKTETNSKSTEKDLYDGWQTYKDDTFGYSLKYPADWKFNDKKSLDQKNSEGNMIYSPPTFTSADGQKEITLNAGKLTGTYANAKEAFKQEGAGRAGDVLQDESITINSYSAYNAKTTHMGVTFSIYSVMNKGVSVDLSSNYSNNEMVKMIANSIKFN